MKQTITLLILLILLMLASCGSNSISKSETKNIDWAMLNFVKVDSINPILEPQLNQVFQSPISNKQVHWEERNVLNPSAIVKDGKVYLIYRAQDKDMTSRLGLAISEDGLHFKKQPAPIFYPDNDTMKQYEWKGGVEDPRVIESENGTYIMTYTSYDGKTARLCIASSKDLKTWTKHGLMLQEEKHKDLWSKSGAIVCKLDGDKIIATKIKGKYWMYFGDTDLYLATSDDLIHWKVAENEESKKMITVLHPRMGYFDSRLVEPGPFALLQKQGIVLIYNGSNAANYNEPGLPKFTYAASQALFDKEKPYKLIDRMEDHFIHPDKPYEKTGEVNEVCFVEGLVYFKKQWFLYYGTADSKIAVAVKK
ncbi:glycoside hydrolase family 130 protein [Flavobacterium sp. LB3P45]|uniref:Glycoside hydrolase family 130 protein n=1 Tax=Flavobacterium fructosi TaxID=3230416 RepID=A0ABW6HJ60_9FLAO